MNRMPSSVTPAPTAHRLQRRGAATSMPCRVSPAPQAGVLQTTRFQLETVRTWEATRSQNRAPLLRRSWAEFRRSEQRALECLGFDQQRWTACVQGLFAELPPAARGYFAQLSAAQQGAAGRLGFDSESWDCWVATHRDALAHPRLLARFAQLRAARQPLNSVRSWGVLRRSGQRASACLRDFAPQAFTADGRMALTEAVNQRVPWSFRSHGWTTSVVPARTAAEVRRAARQGGVIVNDASGMSAAAVVSMEQPQTLWDLRTQVLRARHFGWRINCAGARHSQGGQSCVGGAVNVDMQRLNGMALQPDNTIWVGAGATWEQVIDHLKARESGRTVQVMQASNIFSVGGSLSVNCHGRTANDAPIASTVEELRIMQSDGRIVTCSPTHNPNLFTHALGGYGMVGIIVAARLRTVPDRALKMSAQHMPVERFPEAMAAAIRADLPMAFGRLSPTFSGDAILSTAEPVGMAPIKAKKGLDFERLNWTWIEQLVLQVSKLSNFLLGVRWWLEKKLRANDSWGTSSEMLNLRADGLAQLPWREGRRTDVLEELFLPFNSHAEGAEAAQPNASFTQFVKELDEVQRRHKQCSLNITVRNVRADTISALPYAKQDSLAFVLYYNQRMTARDKQRRAGLQRDLVSLAQKYGGSFYLPYLRGYSDDQLRAGYPGLQAALGYKQQADRADLFAPVLLPE